MLKLTLPFLGLMAVLNGGLSESEWEERPDWGRFYEEAGVEGVFLLYDLARDRYLVYNAARVDAPFIPASTFKIFNALVALETGVIRDEEETLVWDGVDRGWDQWNRDHNLRSAMKYSAVWFYQELARRIGQERMQHYIDRAGYGNQDIGGGIDRFWLDGALRITPQEQVDFLVRLYRNDLPFSRRSMEIVKDILTFEETDDYVLRAKTGWAARFTPEVGWFVGYLERDGKAYFFANNLDIEEEEDSAARIAITRHILCDLKLIAGATSCP